MTAGFGRVLVASVALATISVAAYSPSTLQITVPVGTGIITGRVVDAVTGRAVSGVGVQLTTVREDPTTFPIQDCCGMITVSIGGDFGRGATTDADGRFVFANLPARTFELLANGSGWSWTMWRRSSLIDFAHWIELRDGQRVDGVRIALPPISSVGGRVFDERGEPVPGLEILLTPPAQAGAPPRYVTRVATDDRGIYRAVVQPGEYVVSTVAYPPAIATSLSQSTSAFRRIFFPQATSVEAAALVTLRPGDERTDLDFIVKPERVFRIAITGIADGPANLQIELFPAGRLPGSAPLANFSGSQRAFAFAGVPPGRYILRALSPTAMPFMTHGTAALKDLPPGPTLWAEQSIAVVDRDVEVRLALQPGVRISGRVEFDGAQPSPPLTVLNNRALIVERSDGSESDFRGVFLPGDRFSTIQIVPGRYIVRPGPPERWRLKSVMADGRDISDYPVELGQSDVDDVVMTFTDKRSAIAGRLIRERPEDLARGWITVFPTDRAYWPEYGVYPRRIVFIECGRSGLFEAEVPPGSYYVAATTWPTRGHLSAEQLSMLAASSAAVVVGENQTVTQDVRFPRVR